MESKGQLRKLHPGKTGQMGLINEDKSLILLKKYKNERIRGVRMEFHVVIPVLISFAISLVLGPIVIPFLRRLKMGQTERELGVQSHLKRTVPLLWVE